MQRLTVEPSSDWRERPEAAGLPWHPNAAYSFSPSDIDVLGDAAQRLEDLCLDWVEVTVRRGDYAAFGLSDTACGLIEDSWRRQDKNLLGRIDLIWNSRDAPRMLRYAADAPDALPEAAVLQADWLDGHGHPCDQFNSIGEMLVEAWKHFGLWGHRVHFTALRDKEGREHATALGGMEYLRSTAQAAGLEAAALHLDELRWNGRRFADPSAKPITVLCHHCGWDALLQHPLAANLHSAGLRLIEPAWKLLLTQEATLPLLRADHPGEPHLEPTAILPQPGSPAPVLGMWIVASRPCGLGIQEHDGSGVCFVPHRVE